LENPSIEKEPENDAEKSVPIEKEPDNANVNLSSNDEEKRKINEMEKIVADTDDSIMLSDDEPCDEDENKFLNANKSDLSSNEDYTLLCLHLDTFKASNESTFTISQLGCCTANLSNNKPETFFTPIKPPKLENYLENYKMEGDLLKALHVTDSDKGRFEFRAQFEIKRKEKNKIYCTSETEAIDNLKTILKTHERIIIFAIDKETIEHFLFKLNLQEKEKSRIVGFMTWSDVLKFTSNFVGYFSPDTDLEDFYSENCGKVAGYINALDVSTFLSKSIKKLFNEYAKKLSKNDKDSKFSWFPVYKEIVRKMEEIKEPVVKASSNDENNLSVEVYSSFRPCVSTKINLMKMETMELSSGPEKEDSDIETVQAKIVNKPKQKLDKGALKKRLQQQFHLLKRKREAIQKSSFPMQLRKKPRKLPSSGPIVITSSDDDTDAEEVDHVEIAKVLENRNPGLRVTTIDKNQISPQIQIPVHHSPQNLNNVRITTLPKSQSGNIVPHCAICNVEFGNTLSLKIHIERIHLRCNICNAQFNTLDHAINHRRIHFEAAPPSDFEPFVVLEENATPSGNLVESSTESLLREDTDCW